MTEEPRKDWWESDRAALRNAGRDAAKAKVASKAADAPSPGPQAPLVRARSPVVWLRRILLSIGLLTLVGIAILLAAYRFGQVERPADDPNVATPEIRADEDAVTAGEGFDYTQWSDGQRVFRIRAERSQRNRDDTATLETVTLDIHRDDGEIYTVTSRRAQVNQRSWASILEGDVEIAGWGDLTVRARALELQQGGQVLISRGAVEFDYPPNIVGRASRLRLDRAQDVINLSGGVHLRSTPSAEVPLRLDCERLVYRRGEGLIRAVDDIVLVRGDQELESRTLTIYLAEDQRTVRTLRARWDVIARSAMPTDFGGVNRMELTGDLVDVEPAIQFADTYRIRIEGGAEKTATLTNIDFDGTARRLTGNVLDGQINNGQLGLIRGEGDPFVLDEYLDLPDGPYPLRQACAHNTVARFLPDGELGHLTLEGQVELRDEELHLSGGRRAVLEGEEGILEIRGPAVDLFSERGAMTAPVISYSRELGLIRASEGVQTTMAEGTALGDTPFSRGQGPLRVESESALWSDDAESTFSFRGSVRAWRGQNLLLADQVRGDSGGGEMAASGKVKTVWIPESGTGGPGSPVAVDAKRMSYQESDNTLVYDEDVIIQQDDRTIRCRELTVELTSDGSGTPGDARRMLCNGEVQMVDTIGGRRISGDLAIFTVANDQVEVFGDQVKLVDAARNTLTGRYLIYDLNAGTVQIKGRVPDTAVAGGR